MHITTAHDDVILLLKDLR